MVLSTGPQQLLNWILLQEFVTAVFILSGLGGNELYTNYHGYWPGFTGAGSVWRYTAPRPPLIGIMR